jgi:hypothetical protein
MQTLIIHPKDSTTTFLELIYGKIPDKTIISGGVSKEQVKDLIQSHERVMMLGHGSPSGLFSVGSFPDTNGYIIDQTMVELLNRKRDNIFIWCNADSFVNQYRLKGFYSGMFISEVEEADYCGLVGTSQNQVDESNLRFGEIFSGFANEDTSLIYKNVLIEYGKLAEKNPVASYNCKRLYKSQ